MVEPEETTAPAGRASDPDAAIADRVFDLGQAGFAQQLGERADQVGVGRQRRAAAAEPHRAASPGSSSIRLGDRFERQFVSLRAQAADHAARREAHIGMVAEALAAKDVRQMHLDHRQTGGGERVEHGDRGMGQRAGIQNDAVGRFTRLLDPVDQLAFVIGLAKIDLQVERGRAREAARFDIGQGVMAVDRRLAHPEQVQIGAVEHKDGRHASSPSEQAGYSTRGKDSKKAA